MSPEENKDIVRRFQEGMMEAFRTGNLDLLAGDGGSRLCLRQSRDASHCRRHEASAPCVPHCVS